MAQVVAAAAGAMGRAPVFAALTEVLEIERRFGVPSTWFILTGDPTLARWRRGDVTYRLEGKGARRCLAAIQGAGHEVGLHGSMATWTDAATFAAERARLARATETPVHGGRQHFLKMRPGATQRAMTGAGLAYDASYGFSGRNGFRLGVADIVPAWDAAAGTGSALEEVPLHWMDRALSKYQGIEDPRELVADGLALAEAARVEEGLWVGLWHPNLAPALGYPRAPEAFAWMLEELAGQGAWMARLGEVVAWRRARRSARARAVAPDGRGELATARSASFAITLEDADGRAA
jgi:peptidoglycan/xylan/chitin deacetylase (PgdA/CDA1 family)